MLSIESEKITLTYTSYTKLFMLIGKEIKSMAEFRILFEIISALVGVNNAKKLQPNLIDF